MLVGHRSNQGAWSAGAVQAYNSLQKENLELRKDAETLRLALNELRTNRVDIGHYALTEECKYYKRRYIDICNRTGERSAMYSRTHEPANSFGRLR